MPRDRAGGFCPLARRQWLALAMVSMAGFGVRAQDAAKVPSEVAADLPGARLLGRGNLSFLGLQVYDGRLWVGEGFQPEQYRSQPLALELIYARTLYGKLIAERSLTEMRKQAEVPAEQGERWLAEMTRLFPDVAKGDRITGVQRPGEGTKFFFNGQLRGELRDAAFTQRFFDIWLSPRTSEPALRQALLGNAGK